MADETVARRIGEGSHPKLLRDMGDGTWAEVIALAAGASIDLGDVELKASEAHVGQVGGAIATVRVEKTRTADTNAYAANDAWNTATSGAASWTFAVGRIATGSGIIIGAQIACDQSAYVARFELDLYDADVAVVPQDNAEATRLYTNQSKFLQTVTFPAMAKKTTNSNLAEAANTDLRIPFKCVGASSIYGVLRTLDAIATPVSGAKITITLLVAQD